MARVAPNTEFAPPCRIADSAIAPSSPSGEQPNCLYLGSRIFFSTAALLTLVAAPEMSRLLSETGDPCFFRPGNQAVAYLLVQPIILKQLISVPTARPSLRTGVGLGLSLSPLGLSR
jgi:hypothetical protein